ncbi:ACT domain-containing protein, partial [Streptococcus agalactiae]|nr:ACT domain-containing protein [Streptococcus agalactiae]MCK6343213.1 ACT domain-containing protein [Streptococcus agalactiae]
FEHMPTGIDDLSIVLREKELTPIKEQEILNYLTRKLEVDYVDIQHNLSTIVIVGENMKSQIGVTATATQALSREKINITMISQGSSEVSIMFVINSKDEKRAIKALYET